MGVSVRACNTCGIEKRDDAFMGGRAKCEKCRSSEQVLRERKRLIDSGLGRECNSCKVVRVNSKFDRLDDGTYSRSCAKCRDRQLEYRARRRESVRFKPGDMTPRPGADLLKLLHAMPGEPGAVLRPMVACPLPEAA